MYCDNISVVYLSKNPAHHQQTKHVEIDIHFVCEKVPTRGGKGPPPMGFFTNLFGSFIN
jgi:hypothetical protein